MGGDLRVHYRSERLGLASFVVGLLRGLAELLGENVSVEHEVSRAALGAHEVFLVRHVS